MNQYFYRLCLLLTTLWLTSCSAFISATSPEPIATKEDSRSTGSFIDDEIIEIKALVNIEKADPALAQSHIVVVSYNAIVLLAGQVSSQELRQLAATTVANIPKVRRVHNELTVSGSVSMVARSNDAWITAKVKSKMLTSGQLESNRIKVLTENGVVYLLGLVSRAEADRATELSRKSAGVQKVVRIFEYITP